jgi:hypothetical protein
MKKTTFFILLIFSLPLKSIGQTQAILAKNNAYAEVLGVTGYYSINYERFLYTKKYFRVSTSIGFSHIQYNDAEWLDFPVRLHFLVGKNKWYGELGYVELLTWEKILSFRGYWLNKGFERYPLVHIGVRYQGDKNKLMLKAYIFPLLVNGTRNTTYLPLIAHYDKWHSYFEAKKAGRPFVWWGGIGVGYAF